MATRFELVLHGDDRPALRAAGEEALAEISFLEDQLSFYRPHSEIGRLNQSSANTPTRVSGRVFGLLKHAKELYRLTAGAFDITVAPLMKCWGFVRGKGRWPDKNLLVAARASTGMQHLILNSDDGTVTFERENMSVDLGGIGKGYAIDEAISILRDCGVECAFLHGGTSTMACLGSPPGEESWRVAIPTSGNDETPLAFVPLHDQALSVSAEWGKAFMKNGKSYGHVIDPRSGLPAEGATMAAVTHRNATTADALSTALLINTPEERTEIIHHFDPLRLLISYSSKNIFCHGIDLCDRVYRN